MGFWVEVEVEVEVEGGRGGVWEVVMMGGFGSVVEAEVVGFCCLGCGLDGARDGDFEVGGLGVEVDCVGCSACSAVAVVVVVLGFGLRGASSGATAVLGGPSSSSCFFSTTGEDGGIGMSVSARYTETNCILASAVLNRSSPCMFGWVSSAFHLRRVSCAVSSIAERALLRSSNFLRRSSKSD